MYQVHSDFPQRKSCTGEQLEAIMNAHILNTSDIAGPLAITSIRMAVRGVNCFVITKTACGIEGISIASGNW